MYGLLNQLETIIKSVRPFTTTRLPVHSSTFLVGRTANSDDTNTYFVLDSISGSVCVGHWLHECGIYTTFYKTLKSQFPSLRILCNGYKRYKEHFLDAAGIDLATIFYTSTTHFFDAHTLQKSCQAELFLPHDTDYTVIYPDYSYLEFLTSYVPPLYYTLLDEYKLSLPFTSNVTKDIEFVYFMRTANRAENISGRKFVNQDEIIDLMKKYNIPVYDVKDFNSIKEQVAIVERAKTIIVEHGSAWFINGILMANKSHSIILNRISNNCHPFEDELTKRYETPYEFVLSTTNTENNYDIYIPISRLEEAILKRLSL